MGELPPLNFHCLIISSLPLPLPLSFAFPIRYSHLLKNLLHWHPIPFFFSQVTLKVNFSFIMRSSTVAFLLCATSAAANSVLVKRQYCSPNYFQCQPAGATSSDVPATGSGLASLYYDILRSIKIYTARETSLLAEDLEARDTPNICCKSTQAFTYAVARELTIARCCKH
jgi:hypothetical protein